MSSLSWLGPVLRRWTFACTLCRLLQFSCIAQGSRGHSLRGRGSRILPAEPPLLLRLVFSGFMGFTYQHLYNPWDHVGLWTKLDKEKNQCIRQKTGAQNIAKEIKQYQKKWLQHVQRMYTNRLPKQALQYQPKGRRNIGRPRKRWRDQLHLEDHGTGNTPNPSGTWWWW